MKLCVIYFDRDFQGFVLGYIELEVAFHFES